LNRFSLGGSARTCYELPREKCIFNVGIFMVARGVWIIGLMLLCGGCRVTPQQRAVLTQYEHDLRRYEDLIYELEYEYEILADENERLREKLADAEGDDPSSSPRRLFRSTPAAPPSRSAKPPLDDNLPPMDELAPPLIEKGSAAPMQPASPDLPPVTLPTNPTTVPRTSLEPPPSLERSPRETERTLPEVAVPQTTVPESVPAEASPRPTEKLPSSAVEPTPTAEPPSAAPQQFDVLPLPGPRGARSNSLELLPEPATQKVSALWVDPQATRGLDRAATGGDEGVLLVAEPRNADGEGVTANGKVTVVLIDPQLSGEAARLGRWEFTPEQVRYASRRRRLELPLPWQERAPEHDQLALFVRYETEEGERIDAKQLVQIRPPQGALASHGWTPRATPANAQVASSPTTAAEVRPVAHVAAEPEREEVVAAQPEGAASDKPLSPPGPRPKPQRPEWKPYR
jgi:hypothetical protein